MRICPTMSSLPPDLKYSSALNFKDKLWISNIYASTADGEQFVNGIGFVAEKGSAKAEPFDSEYAIDVGNDSTSGVFPPKFDTASIVVIIAVIAAGAAFGVFLAKKGKRINS